jgi:hypothetical protein
VEKAPSTIGRGRNRLDAVPAKSLHGIFFTLLDDVARN